MSTYHEGLQTEPAASGEGMKERAVEAVAEVDAGAMHVAGVAGEEAKSVAHEAKSAARGFLDETKTQLTDQAATQQRRAADALRSAGDELSQMASSAGGRGMATGLVRGLGQRSSDAATWLQDRQPADLVREVRGFARRHTGVFLIVALGVGIVAGRLTRALASGASGSGASGAPGQRADALDGAASAGSPRDVGSRTVGCGWERHAAPGRHAAHAWH